MNSSSSGKRPTKGVSRNTIDNNIYSDSRMAKRKKKGGKGKFLASFLCFLLIFLGCFTIGGAIYFFNMQNNNGNPPVFGDESNSPGNKTRKEKVEYFLIAGIDDTANLSDVIIIMAYDKLKDEISLLQIPRDTYVGESIPTGKSCKINAIHNHAPKGKKGIEALADFISSQFQIPIDHYVTVTIKGFRGAVDAIGGVDIDNPKQVVFGRGKVIPKGRVHLDGTKAEWFVRERHSRAGGDLGRIQAQQRFLAAVASKILNKKKADLISDVLPNVYKHVNTDLSTNDIVDYISKAQKISLDKIKIFIMPGEQTTYQPKGQSIPLSYFSANKYDAFWLLQEYFNPYGDINFKFEKFLTEVKKELIPSKLSPEDKRPKPVVFSEFDD